jgi:hypothetical protein
VHGNPETVERLLEELEELGYLDLEGSDGLDGGRRVWLTVEGYDLVYVTESALLAASSRN